MLKIRLQRVGRKHEPTFRLVLTDSKNSTKSGRYLENLGSYDSRHGEDANFKADRVKHWMSQGAQVSATVHNMLVSKKLVEGKKINVLPLKKAIVKEVAGETVVSQADPVVAVEKAVETPAPAVLAEETPAEVPVEVVEPAETEASA